MARKTSDNRYILSAGEIGVYTVCPESWKLRVIEGKSGEKSESIKLGSDLHNEWALDHEEALFFDKGVRMILLLAAVAIIIALAVIN